jgi:hypothetical protein
VVTSTLSQGHWLLLRKEEQVRNSNFKMLPDTLHPCQTPSPSTVRRPWKGISTPFKHIESNHRIHLSMGLLWRYNQKRSNFRQQKNPPNFTPLLQFTTSVKKIVRGAPYTYSMHWIQL